MMNERKIIHIDMDAFYASVEQRDNPVLRGKPIAVGYAEERGVVAAASYEARRFGVRSAMSSLKAKRLCPQLIFIPGRMEVYKSVSCQIHEIFHEYTDIIEPLSLDECFSGCHRKIKKILFIFNQLDRFDPADDSIEESLKQFKRLLKNKKSEAGIVPISAKAAYLLKKEMKSTLSKFEEVELRSLKEKMSSRTSPC